MVDRVIIGNTVQKCWCVGYYRIDKNNTRTIPIPRSRNETDVSGLYPWSSEIAKAGDQMLKPVINILQWRSFIACVHISNSDFYSHVKFLQIYPSVTTSVTSSKTFDIGYMPETSVIFLLRGSGFLMKGIWGICPKRQSYFYSVVLEFYLSCVERFHFAEDFRRVSFRGRL